ncbi:hypothetical protein [Streptomyces sp. NPDC003015]
MSADFPSLEAGTATDREAHKFLLRIERLANFMLGGKFEGSADLWDFQIDLLKLQREIQSCITAEKHKARATKGKSEKLTDLQQARWSSRRLGDAFAWLLLGLDDQSIFALAENSPVPISQESHGSRGMVEISRYLASRGWGFPLIHDVTDCLRIGDVTFVRPDEGQRSLRTVELKTRYMGKTEDEPPLAHYEVSVTFLSSEKNPKMEFTADVDEAETAPDVMPPSPTESLPAGTRADRRIDRQARRMATALARREAKHGAVADIDGRMTLTAIVDSSPVSHWKTLRRIIRKARRDGYASECIDKAFTYAAFYAQDGVEVESVKNPKLIQDMTSSGFLHSSKPSRNSVEISSIPTTERNRAQLFLPYFLYSIPRRAVFDLLHGRLIVAVFTNVGHIADALEGHGFEVEVPSAKHAPSQVMEVSSSFTLNDVDYRFKTNAVGQHVTQCIYELKGIDHLVRVVNGMRESAIQAFMEHGEKVLRSPTSTPSNRGRTNASRNSGVQ